MRTESYFGCTFPPRRRPIFFSFSRNTRLAAPAKREGSRNGRRVCHHRHSENPFMSSWCSRPQFDD